jgi:PAT family beta-lactamase induction signal transducer AmpG
MQKLRRLPPVWIMGLTNATFGMMGGFAVVTLPQILAAEGVPGGHIAAMTAAIISPGFWVFLVSPMLDVRFRRRTYALFFGILTALGVGYTVLSHSNVAATEAVMIVAYSAAALYQGTVGGWTGSLITHEQDSQLGMWFNVANVGAGGLIEIIGAPLILHSPPAVAAAVITAAMLLPMLSFTAIPAPEPDRMLASESFERFWREVASLLKRREVIVALVLFALPSASFSLTNVLGGLGKDYHASPHIVSLFAGVGSVVAGIGGSYLVPQLAKRFPLRPLYLSIGFIGALFTLGTLLLPRAPWTFGLVFTGEIIFQSLAFTAMNGITFEVIGPDNPLAATLFTVLIAASMLPITYMGFLDGWGYDRGHLLGSFLMDAGLSMAACLLLAWLLFGRGRRSRA